MWFKTFQSESIQVIDLVNDRNFKICNYVFK
jgi:hypothetical protein